MSLETSAYFGVAVLILSYVVFGVLAHKGYITKWQKRISRIEKAKRLNHMVKGSLIKGGNYTSEANGRVNHTPHGTYEYIVDGKKYEYRKVFTHADSVHPPTSITIYYLNNPRRAFDTDRVSYLDFLWVVPWILGVLVTALLGL